MVQKRVLMIAGDFMDDYEANVPFQALQAFGVTVDAVCPGKKAGGVCRTAASEIAGHQTNSETRGHNFVLNATFDEIDGTSYDGLVLPGGRAPEYLANNPKVVDLAAQFDASGKPISSICHSQLILAAAGVLKGRKCTAYAPVGPMLTAGGGDWVEPESLASSVVHGNILSAATYQAHPEVIGNFVKALGGTITGPNTKILFLCGDYMEDYEVYVPFQSLQALGCHVDAVCPQKKAGDTCPTAIHEFEGDQTYTEKPGHHFILNANFDDVDASSYDALVIPGGRSPEYLSINKSIISIVKHFMESNKPVASTGCGPLVLAAADVLKGRKCTGYPAVKFNMIQRGAIWVEPDPITIRGSITDGNLVTGAWWPGHAEFISQFMKVLGISVSF